MAMDKDSQYSASCMFLLEYRFELVQLSGAMPVFWFVVFQF
jgi:hypothetical protein